MPSGYAPGGYLAPQPPGTASGQAAGRGESRVMVPDTVIRGYWTVSMGTKCPCLRGSRQQPVTEARTAWYGHGLPGTKPVSPAVRTANGKK